MRIAGRANTVHAVAIGAHGDVSIAGGEFLAVHAGLILRKLVGTQRGIVLAHVGGVGMATAAQLRDALAVNVTAEARFCAHRVRGASGISTVATGASQAFSRVDIGGKFRGCHLQRCIERGVAVEAGVVAGRERHERQQKEAHRKCMARFHFANDGCNHASHAHFAKKPYTVMPLM